MLGRQRINTTHVLKASTVRLCHALRPEMALLVRCRNCAWQGNSNICSYAVTIYISIARYIQQMPPPCHGEALHTEQGQTIAQGHRPRVHMPVRLCKQQQTRKQIARHPPPFPRSAIQCHHTEVPHFPTHKRCTRQQNRTCQHQNPSTQCSPQSQDAYYDRDYPPFNANPAPLPTGSGISGTQPAPVVRPGQNSPRQQSNDN
jgi:hypothetical protein